MSDSKFMPAIFELLVPPQQVDSTPYPRHRSKCIVKSWTRIYARLMYSERSSRPSSVSRMRESRIVADEVRQNTIKFRSFMVFLSRTRCFLYAFNKLRTYFVCVFQNVDKAANLRILTIYVISLAVRSNRVVRLRLSSISFGFSLITKLCTDAIPSPTSYPGSLPSLHMEARLGGKNDTLGNTSSFGESRKIF